jgi:hypothetical protein
MDQIHNRVLRPLLIVEFLIAAQTIFTVWSEIGGQYHLDIIFWPWKLGISMVAASLIVAITANLVRNDGNITGRAILFGSFLIATALLAGMVTYYYHLNEPQDDDEDQDDSPAKISRIFTPHTCRADSHAPNEHASDVSRIPDFSPHPASLPAPDHR